MTPHVAAQWVTLALIAGIGSAVVFRIWTRDIDLKFLISEENGNASMSRFQLLIFTFVIGAGFLVLTFNAHDNAFPTMDPNVLGLLGISAGSYLGAKITQRTTPSALPESLGLLEARADDARNRADELLSASGETPTPLASAATALRAAAVAVKAEIAQTRRAANPTSPTA